MYVKLQLTLIVQTMVIVLVFIRIGCVTPAVEIVNRYQ